MEPRLVFVHGIGRHADPERELSAWIEALGDGMRAAGHPGLADDLVAGRAITCRYAHYSDLFYATPGDVTNQTEQDQLLADLLTEVIDQHLAEEQPAEVAVRLDEARTLLNPTGDAQGLGDLGRNLLNACVTILEIPPLRRAGHWLSAKLMRGDLAQVSRYLGRGEPASDGSTLDERIRGRILNDLSAGPTIVVAHSLGTVTSFEALHHHQGPIPLWVTLGSPLGLRTVVYPRLRPKPPRTPGTVAQWLNAWDRDDLIAVRSDLAGLVAGNDADVRAHSIRVDSDGLWVHPATTYLRTPGVAGPIAAAVTSVRDRT